jgi:hypothetical protein
MAVADVNKISDKLWFDLVDERIKDVWKLEDYLKMKADWSTVDVEQATLIYQR